MLRQAEKDRIRGKTLAAAIDILTRIPNGRQRFHVARTVRHLFKSEEVFIDAGGRIRFHYPTTTDDTGNWN